MKPSVLALLVFATACANGTEEEDFLPAGGSSAGGASSGGSTSGGGSSSGGTSSGGVTLGGSGGVGGSGGTGGSGGSTGGFGGTGGSGGTSCAANATCQAANAQGSLTGDKGPKTKTVSDYGSSWVKVRITEDSSSPIGEKLEVKIDLDVPVNIDLDMKAYVNTGKDTSPCGLAPAAKANSGGIGSDESLTLKWGEGAAANGDDDDRDVLIEIIHKAGTCDPNNKWTLN